MQFSGRTSAYVHKGENWASQDISGVKPGLRKVTALDAQWSTCPVEVEQQVKDLWRAYECGNDKYVIITSIAHLREIDNDPETSVESFNDDKMKWENKKLRTDAILFYLESNGITDEKEEIWIHWWW